MGNLDKALHLLSEQQCMRSSTDEVREFIENEIRSYVNAHALTLDSDFIEKTLKHNCDKKLYEVRASLEIIESDFTTVVTLDWLNNKR